MLCRRLLYVVVNRSGTTGPCRPSLGYESVGFVSGTIRIMSYSCPKRRTAHSAWDTGVREKRRPQSRTVNLVFPGEAFALRDSRGRTLQDPPCSNQWTCTELSDLRPR